jgi:hypothetical protein
MRRGKDYAVAVESAKEMVSAEMPEQEDVAEVMDVPETKEVQLKSPRKLWGLSV